MIKPSRLFWKQIRIYLVWIAAFSISIAIFTQYLYLQMEKEIYKNGHDTLKHSVELSETVLLEVESFAYNLGTDNSILKLLNEERNYGDLTYGNMFDAYMSIKSFAFMNDIVDQYYVFFFQSEKVLSDVTTSVRSKIFYDTNIKYAGIVYEQWLKDISELMDKRYYVSEKQHTNNIQKTVVDYQMAIPVGMKKQSKGCIVMSINLEKLMDLIVLENSNNAAYAIINDNKVIISENTPGYGEEVYKISQTGVNKIGNLYQIVEKSELTGWYYVTVIPRNSMMKQAIAIRNTGILLLLVMIILGVVGVSITTLKTSKAINNIVSLLPIKTENSNDVIQSIHNSVKGMIEDNAKLTERIIRQRKNAKESFLTRLMTHYFSNHDDLQTYMDYSGIESCEGPYILAIGKIDLPIEVGDKDYYTQYDSTRLILGKVIYESFAQNTIIRSMSIDKIAILITKNYVDIEDTSQRLREFALEINKTMELHLGFVMSHKFYDLLDYPIVYSSIDKLFSTKFVKGREVILETKEQTEGEYIYTIDNEMRLINIMKTGNTNLAVKYIEEILEFNSALNDDRLTSLLNSLQKTLGKIVYSHVNNDMKDAVLSKLDNLRKSYYISDYKKGIFEITDMICRHLSPDNSKINMIGSIKDYIEKNYKKTNLGLTMIAENYGMSEKYISRLYKNATGMNLSNYIEEVRMLKACQLIKDGQTNFNNVAIEVGYFNYNTFYKAFNRYFGKSPKAYSQNK